MRFSKFTSIVLSLSILCRGMCDQNPLYRFDGMFEEYSGRRLTLIGKFLSENPVIFEAGGHYGEDSVHFLHYWPNASVLTFEANPDAFAKLQERIKPYPQIRGYNLAVNNYNGIATFYVCYGTNGNEPVFEGASSILEPSECMKHHYQGPKITVPCIKLDDWCHQNDVDHIDFMWLDLEGLELQILKSSPEILKTVKVIYTETNMFEFRKGTTQFLPLKRFLERSGFKLLAHWYLQGLQGDAIFVRKDVFIAAMNSLSSK